MIKRSGEYKGILNEVVEHNGVLYLAGILADDLTLDMAGQTRQTLELLKQCLEQHGSGIDRLLSTTVFITDMSLKAEMNRAWKEFFGGKDLPTRATIGIATLDPGVLIEVVSTAAAGRG